MIKKILLLSIVVYQFVLNPAFAAKEKGLKPTLALSPARLEIYPEKDKSSQSISVLNLGEEPMKVEIRVQNWDLDENNQYRAQAPTPQSLDQWILINPVRLTIPANSQQTVRLAIRPRVKPDAGEHRAMIFFRQLPDPNKKGRGQVSFNVGVPVYAYFGEIKNEAVVNDVGFDIENSSFYFDIENKGNAYVRPTGAYLVLDAKDYEGNEKALGRINLKKNSLNPENSLASGKLAAQPVLAGQTRRVLNFIDLSAFKQDIMLVLKVDIGGKLISKIYLYQTKTRKLIEQNNTKKEQD